MDFRGIAYLIVLGVVGAGAVAVWRNWDTIKTSINPADPNNLASSVVSSAVTAVTGGARTGSSTGESTLGGIFARAREVVFGTDAAIERMKAGAPAKPTSNSDAWRDQLDASSPYGNGVFL